MNTFPDLQSDNIVTASDVRWLRLAILQAEQSKHDKWKVGAIVVRGGSVVGRGFNRYRNDPALVPHQDVSYHAETVAIRRAGDNTVGATIYVARITSGGNLGLAKPCDRCQNLLEESGIQSVIWTASSGMEKVRMSELVNRATVLRRAS